MATEIGERRRSTVGRVRANEWTAGAVGGFLGSVVFGLFMQFVMPPPLLEIVIPAMYGIEGPALLAGWALHLFHGVVLGVVYVALVQYRPLRGPARRLGGSVGLALGYAAAMTLVLAGLVMPLWLSAVGFAAAPPFPNLSVAGTAMSFVGHVLYAVPVAVGYALVARSRDTP